MLHGEARLEPAQHPVPPLSLSWPVILDLSDLFQEILFFLGTFCLLCYSLFLSFTAHLRSSHIGCCLSCPFIILGISHISVCLSKTSRCGSCLSMAESLSSLCVAAWLCPCGDGDLGLESPGAVAASCRVRDRVCWSLHLLAIRSLSLPKGSAVSQPHLGLVELSFFAAEFTASPQRVFLCCPRLCHAPHLLQPNSGADGDQPPDTCPRFATAAGSPVGPHYNQRWGSPLHLKGEFGLHCAPSPASPMSQPGDSSRASGRGETPGTYLDAVQILGRTRGQAGRWTRGGSSGAAGAGGAARSRRRSLCPQGAPGHPRRLARPLVHAVRRPLSFVPPLCAGSGRVS